MDVGVRALPILSLITFFIGLILALQAAYELRRFGAMSAVATAVAISMSRELGPLLTAIVVIGRSGSAFAAEIGTMKVSEEIDALETMAISPIRFLVAPKFLAMVVMLPCLTIWANAMGILGGALFGVAQADFTYTRYIRASHRLSPFARRHHWISEVRNVRNHYYGRRVSRRVVYRGRSRAGGPVHNSGCGHVDFSGHRRRSVLHRSFLFCEQSMSTTQLFASAQTRTRDFAAQPAR